MTRWPFVLSVAVIMASCTTPYQPGVGDVGSVVMVDPRAPVVVDPEPLVVAPEPVTTPEPVAIPEPLVVTPPPEPVVVAATEPVVMPSPVPPAPPTPRIDVEIAGDDYRVSIDGVRVAKDHLRRTDSAIEIVASSGAVLHSIPVPAPKEHPSAMIGVRFEAPGPALKKHLADLKLDDCSLVIAVMADGPGHAAGVEDFDIVTAIDGNSPASPAAIRTRIAALAPGDPITFSIRRGDSVSEVKLTSIPWKHVPIPMELQQPQAPIAPSPKLEPTPGTPNAPQDTDSRGRPAAAPQRSSQPTR